MLIFCIVAALIGGVFLFLKSQSSSASSGFSSSSSSSSDSQVAARQVDFDLNGYDSIAAPAAQSIAQGGYAIAPIITRIGYTLQGWSTLASGGEIWDFAADPIVADTTLYAQWELDVYLAQFDLAGGSGPSIPDQSKNYLTYQESGGSTSITSKLSAPTGAYAKDGFILDGWWLEDSGGSFVQEWNFGSDLLLHDVTLHAGWSVSKTFGNYTISEYDTAVKITGYNGASAGGTLTIPSSINGKPVLSIGTKAFYGFADPDTSNIILPSALASERPLAFVS